MMAVRRSASPVWISFVGLLVAGAVPPSSADEACKPGVSPDLVKKDTWQATMLATRANVGKCLADQERTLKSLQVGPWYTTGPMKVKNFKHARFPERGVDLAAKGKDDKPLWEKRADWQDDVAHRLERRADSASTYLYRTITSPNPITVTAYFGSDDGLAAWLNGKLLLEKDVPRGLGANQDKADLCLKAGENQLLLKIHNQTGDHGYYFSIRPGVSHRLWQQVEQAYPLESGWMKRDVPGAGCAAWFRSGDNTTMESAMISRAVKDLGASGGLLGKSLADLQQAKAPAKDPRWLDLYVKTCRFRDAVAELSRVDPKPLRLAVEDLNETYAKSYAKGPEYLKRLTDLEQRLPTLREGLAKGNEDALRQVPEFVKAFGSLRNEALLANPAIDFDNLLIVRRRADRHGLPQNWQGNCAIARTGYDNEIAVFSPVKPCGKMTTLFKPKGAEFVGDVDLHFDADRMLFSMPGSHGRWQIWEMAIDGSRLRQVTPGEHPDVDNYDACYLPDGRIIFASTRCFQGIPCVGGGNTVANLCIMDADGKNIRQLCFDQDHNWCPTVMNNGRVLFSRWEYTDTPHYFSRLLFQMNPDGTGQMEYYGSNSFWPNSIFYARPLPNHPTAVIAVISGHHGVPRMGELILFDPAKGRFEADGAVQRIPGYGKKVDPIIVDQLVNASWPRFLHPYPISDKHFLVSCQPTPTSCWGLYLVDVYDNMLLLSEEPGWQLFEPVPLRKTPKPPAIPDKVDLKRDDAVVYLSDIYFGKGLDGVPRGTIKKLRIFEPYYSYPQMGGHIHVGIEGPWDVHRILGTVPVFEDGSAIFRAPANMPLTVQALDEEGKAVQIMRSWFTPMPGEVLSCVGCHERQNSSSPIRRTIASTHKPCEIEPWYGPTRGFSFKRDVQPVLDKFCVGCHDGHKRPNGCAMLDFRAKDKNGWSNFTQSYIALHPYVRRPGPESDYHLPKPYEYHADTSELIQMLKKGHHNVQLDAEAWDRLYTWIDLNVPDHGTWGEHRKIPGNWHQRRLEMRKRYANRPEDPEVIPEIKRPPIQFVKPAPMPERPKQEIACNGWPFDAVEAKRRQDAAGPRTRRSVDLGNGIKMDLTLIPAGEFVMGCLDGYPDEAPLAAVKIAQPFWMATMEVTTGQFQCFDPDQRNGVIDQQNKDHTTRGYPIEGPQMPVVRVSWRQAMAFCQWLGAKTGESFTLPTESQWEWACRAGTATPLSHGDLNTDFGGWANLADVSIKLLAVQGVNPQPIPNPNQYQDFLPKDPRFDDKARIMTEVGKYQPNAWGLYDMHGNAAEWTRSLFKPYPYREDDGRNDVAAAGRRVVRGGSWFDRPKHARSAYRLAYHPHQCVYNVSFRVVCPVVRVSMSRTPGAGGGR
ncbi:MAG: SUMF1/EgtB/PvdO family nonheme iron enzyme [Phycisphaerae bacterium]|nr:SUMF1/EgtB/PvdO family nonheme iron enzyme [Phycisphaerae bacterium]